MNYELRIKNPREQGAREIFAGGQAKPRRDLRIWPSERSVSKKILLATAVFLTSCFMILASSRVFAAPSSTNFELSEYGFGAGGTASSSSESLLMQGILGEIESSSLSSEAYLALPGLTYSLEPNTPGAPTFTNPDNYYNKLYIIINNANNPSDVLFKVQISSGSADFSQDTFFVQSDQTLGFDEAWQTYSAWGGGSGFNIIGLKSGTTYYARVAAKSGTFQEGIYGPTANAATVIPTLTFDIDTTSQTDPPFTVSIGGITPGSVTTSTDTIDATITTNASNGGLIYLFGTNNGLESAQAGNYNINSVTNDLTLVPEGYGARGTSASEVSGGPMEILTPYNGSGDSVGIIDTNKRPIAGSTQTPVTTGQVSFELKAKASSTTPSASDYTDLLTIIATGAF